ncbi:MAG: type II secretion system F family protein [Nanoarchaeota archaeon]|nr:type II secretion system F family protein [Nanoarchaeota archaeon]
MVVTNFIRGLVKSNPELKFKLKKANSKLTPFQYVYQMLTMAIMTVIAMFILDYIIFKKDFLKLAIGFFVIIGLSPLVYRFWFSYVDVQITKYGRLIDGDLLFVSEFFLVSLESGLPLGNAIQRLAKLKRPGGEFFSRVYTDFQTGKDLERALDEASSYSASNSMKTLLKRLQDSLSIGVDLRNVLENFIEESSKQKIIEIRAYSKKLNPIVMMYLLMGIVLPSLGVTFFILAAAMLEMTPELLKWVLTFIFLIMFLFQYMSYSAFKFGKSSI